MPLRAGVSLAYVLSNDFGTFVRGKTGMEGPSFRVMKRPFWLGTIEKLMQNLLGKAESRGRGQRSILIIE